MANSFQAWSSTARPGREQRTGWPSISRLSATWWQMLTELGYTYVPYWHVKNFMHWILMYFHLKNFSPVNVCKPIYDFCNDALQHFVLLIAILCAYWFRHLINLNKIVSLNIVFLNCKAQYYIVLYLMTGMFLYQQLNILGLMIVSGSISKSRSAAQSLKNPKVH